MTLKQSLTLAAVGLIVVIGALILLVELAFYRNRRRFARAIAAPIG
jgi:hypothetical protein